MKQSLIINKIFVWKDFTKCVWNIVCKKKHQHSSVIIRVEYSLVFCDKSCIDEYCAAFWYDNPQIQIDWSSNNCCGIHFFLIYLIFQIINILHWNILRNFSIIRVLFLQSVKQIKNVKDIIENAYHHQIKNHAIKKSIFLIFSKYRETDDSH